jgi:Holliday junction resolvase RusA-like endonuclease
MTQAPAATEARRQVIRLPLAPSCNNLFINNRRGRCKSPAYRKWLKAADKYVLTQWGEIKKVVGKATVLVRIPHSARGDAENRLKATCDYLVSRELTDDDRNYTRVTVERADIPAGECEVVVEAVT